MSVNMSRVKTLVGLSPENSNKLIQGEVVETPPSLWRRVTDGNPQGNTTISSVDRAGKELVVKVVERLGDKGVVLGGVCCQVTQVVALALP